MTPRSSLTSIIAVLAVLALPAFAQTAGAPAASPGAAAGSTQTFVVPPHNCVAPPYPTKETTMQLRGDAYNRAIEAFNRDAKTYGECMKKYVDDTKVWLKQVADAGNKAVDEFNKYNADIKEKIEGEKQ
jgi:hypothetical protein